MKILIAILSFYMLGLNFVPCNDAEVESKESVAHFSDHKKQEHHNHEHSSDLCSPFCQCHCCHIHIIDFQPVAATTITAEINTQNFLHFENTGKDIQTQLLQPPRA